MPEAAAVEAPAETATESAPEPAEAVEGLGDAGKAAIDRMKAERDQARREAKANADAAKRLAEIEDANKSEQEKLQERLAAAEQREADANARLLRAEVASEKGLTAKQAARLTGTTKEELAADADEFLADLADKYVPKATATPGQTGAGVGGSSTDSTKDNSPDAIAQRLKSQGLF